MQKSYFHSVVLRFSPGREKSQLNNFLIRQMFITSQNLKNEDKFSLIYLDWDEGPWWAKNIRTESIGDIVEILQFHGPGAGSPVGLGQLATLPAPPPGTPGECVTRLRHRLLVRVLPRT